MRNDSQAAFDRAVESLSPSIEKARSDWQMTALEFRAHQNQSDWRDHKAAMELILYLANLEYELKVLLQRFHQDFVNGAVWEKYLGLALFEGVTAVPRMAARVRQDLSRKLGRDNEMVLNFDAATKRFNLTAKQFRADTEFWQLLMRIRNESAAHHTGKGDNLMEMQALWALSTGYLGVTGAHSSESRIGRYALELGRAAHRLGSDLRSSGELSARAE